MEQTNETTRKSLPWWTFVGPLIFGLPAFYVFMRLLLTGIYRHGGPSLGNTQDIVAFLLMVVFVVAYFGMLALQKWSYLLMTMYTGGVGFFLTFGSLYQLITVGAELHKRQYGRLVIFVGCYFLLIFVACALGMLISRLPRVEKKTEPENPLTYPQP